MPQKTSWPISLILPISSLATPLLSPAQQCPRVGLMQVSMQFSKPDSLVIKKNKISSQSKFAPSQVWKISKAKSETKSLASTTGSPMVFPVFAFFDVLQLLILDGNYRFVVVCQELGRETLFTHLVSCVDRNGVIMTPEELIILQAGKNLFNNEVNICKYFQLVLFTLSYLRNLAKDCGEVASL